MPFPAFITELPDQDISIGSSDPTTEGVYNFRIIATDPLTGLQNNEVVFELTMIAIDDVTLIEGSAIPDQIYKVNDPAIALSVPQYSVIPDVAQSLLTYSLVEPTPAFITLNGIDENA